MHLAHKTEVICATLYHFPHTTSITCISQVIKYLWEMSLEGFISPFVVGEFTISGHPLAQAITDYPSFGLPGCCRPMLEMRGCIMRVSW